MSTRATLEFADNVESTTDEVLEIMAAHPRVYQQNGRLTQTLPTSTWPSSGGIALRPICVDTLTELVSGAVRFETYSSKQEKMIGTPPPASVVKALFARGHWPGVRPVTGVIEAPAVRPDGSIVQTRGYDAATGLVYEPSANFARVPDAPTLDDAVAASKKLLDVVSDFPFVGNEHRSAWLSILLTILARPAIAGPVPMFAISATTRGTGKTKLGDVIHNIITGRDAEKRPFAGKEDEFCKSLLPALMSGSLLIFFDNVDAPIQGTALNIALTSLVFTNRKLGSSEDVKAPNNAVFLFTGNNLVISGDTVRRAVPVNLESALENPEDRQGFARTNLIEYVRAERADLVVAALTIVRAYFVAGSPKSDEVKRLGSFEAWSDVVPQILVWVGLPNPMLTRRQLEAEDEDKNTLGRLLELWERLQSVTKCEALKCAQVLREVYPPKFGGERSPDAHPWYAEFREVIETICDLDDRPPTAKAFGKFLNALKGRVSNGLKLSRHKSRDGVWLWSSNAATLATPQANDEAPIEQSAPIEASIAVDAVDPKALDDLIVRYQREGFSLEDAWRMADGETRRAAE